jgi:hypothetical protein
VDIPVNSTVTFYHTKKQVVRLFVSTCTIRLQEIQSQEMTSSITTLRSKKSFSNAGVPCGRDALAGGSVPGRKKWKKRKQQNVRQSSRFRGEPPVDIVDIEEEDPIEEEPVAQMILRGQGKIRCLAFGKYRRTLYPGFFWCSQCDYWEKNGALMGERASMESRRFTCQAEHTSVVFPTQLASTYQPSRALKDIKISIPSSKEPPHDTPPTLNNQNDKSLALLQRGNLHQSRGNETANDKTNHLLSQQLDEAHTAIKGLKVTNRNLNAKINRLRSRNDAETSCDLSTAMTAAANRLGLRGFRLSEAIADAAFDACGGKGKEELVKRVKAILRQTVFTPFNIARLMDLTGGVLNLSGYALLRNLETGAKKYFHGSLLPSVADIQRVFASVERLGDVRAPFKMLSLPSGEAIKFDYEKVLREVIKAYGLETVAQTRGIRIAQSVDGSNLTKYINHTMGGIKVNDRAAIEPGTESLMFAVAQGEERNNVSTVQSRNNCFPLQIHIGREDTQMYLHFKPMFSFLNYLSLNGIGNFKPMNVTTEADLSATWKMTGRGGGAKTCEQPCHCCGIRSKNLHRPAATRCERWCLGKPDDWLCFHRQIVTDEILKEMEEEVKELELALQDILEAVCLSELTVEDPNMPTGSASLDEHSIHFDPTTDAQRQIYSDFVNKELQLRGKAVSGRLSNRRDTLRSSLTKEYHHRRVAAEVKACERPDQALFMLMQCVPCALHMENRIGLKKLQMVLQAGLSGVKNKTLFANQPGGEKAKTAYMMAAVEKTINQSILGSVECPSHWKFPYDGKEKKLKPLSFANYKTRKVINKIELLIEVLVPDGEEKEKWCRLMPNYRAAMQLLRRKEDFTDEDIAECQNKIDLWFHDWVSLTGLDFMTNYVHLMSSGHIAEYLVKHRNLYRHSQQGWEAFNALLKSIFFRLTGRGGGRGGAKSKLKPIARWLQRRVLWLCGLTQEELQVSMERVRTGELASVSEGLPSVYDGQAESSAEQQQDDELDELNEMLLTLGSVFI